MTHLRFAFFLLGFLLMTTQPASAQSVTKSESADSSFYIYLVMGQSNMAGRGKVDGRYARMKHRRVFMMDKNQEWVKASHPVHFDKPRVVGVGPALSFGMEMAKTHKRKKIGLVPCAVGGTSIQHWKPGAYDDRTDTHPWDDAVVRIKEAMADGVIKGVIWHQGESDSAPEKAARYFSDLEDLIQRIRALVGDPDLPFVAGELGRYKDQYQNINKVLEQLSGRVSGTAVASSLGLTPLEDGVHFDSKSANLLGRRMAERMKIIEATMVK